MHVATSTKYMPGVSSQFCILILEYLKKWGEGGGIFYRFKIKLVRKDFLCVNAKILDKIFHFLISKILKTRLSGLRAPLLATILAFSVKGTDRLCKVVELSKQCCGKLL